MIDFVLNAIDLKFNKIDRKEIYVCVCFTITLLKKYLSIQRDTDRHADRYIVITASKYPLKYFKL